MTQKDSNIKSLIFQLNLDQPVIFKLISGEEIIVTDFNVIDENYIVVFNPYTIQKSLLESGYANIYLFKWMSYGDSEVYPIDINMILTYNTPTQKLYDYYLTCLKEEMISDEYRYPAGSDPANYH